MSLRALPVPLTLLVCVSSGLCSGAAHAADVPGSVSVWYRSTEGCPDGQTFVERLRELGRPAALANVGDRVDFVVTLAARSESSAGRLERQTGRGTVAIREVESPECADVAEALALSLELTLEPGAESPALSSSDAPSVRAPSAAAIPPSDTARPLADEVLPPTRRSEPLALRLGAQGSIQSGVAPAPAPGGGLFLELGLPGLPASTRLTVHGAYQRSEVEQVRLAVSLFTARLDGCPWRWDAGALSLEPCLGVDVGVLQASGSGARGHADRGTWAAALALLRSRLQLWPTLAPELQLAAVLPFVRYAFGAPDGEDLFRVRTLGVELSVGARWAP
jgi:hypothetical protein